jgi:hypothetical protein
MLDVMIASTVSVAMSVVVMAMVVMAITSCAVMMLVVTLCRVELLHHDINLSCAIAQCLQGI